ncbi:MAG: polysaccharide biosynthesis/export family protein [Acidobacteriota bacterium]|nr:polysaccharide biosynthesis/export family protein [Acidobacteriota bacterium]
MQTPLAARATSDLSSRPEPSRFCEDAVERPAALTTSGLASRHESSRRSNFGLVLKSALLAVTLLATLPAVAQFNGPALPPSAGINRPTTLTTDPAILFPASRDVVLGSGDVVTVKVFGPGDYLATVRVGVDGKVQLPLIGVVSLGGLTIAAAENFIAKQLIDAGMFRDPQVSLQLVEGPRAAVSLIGEVHGVIPIVGERRLLDILAAAGGLPPTASHIVTIDRPGLAQPIVVDLGTDPARSALANIPVFGGDTIIVARVGVVYVLGAFKTQGAVPILQNSPLTLMQVAALSGGPSFEGDYSDLRIIRTVENRRVLVKIDIKKVLYGKAPDPVLQADDIVFLPDSALKAVIKDGGIGTLLGIVSLAVAFLR